MHCTQIQWIRVESILQITTTLINDHLNSYHLQQPYYNKMCLLTHNKITWPTNSLLKGKNIDLNWCRLQRKQLQNRQKSVEKGIATHRLEPRTCRKINKAEESKNRVANHCTKRALKWKNFNNFNICTPSFPFWKLLLFIYLTHKHHYRAIISWQTFGWLIEFEQGRPTLVIIATCKLGNHGDSVGGFCGSG